MAERAPDCSVIVPTGQRPAELGHCLQTLRHQSISRDRYEVIIVDRVSSDAVAEVCRALARTMPLRVFQTDDRRQSHAKNLGVSAARAPISLFLHDDDVVHPDFVWQHVNAHSRDVRHRVSIRGHTGWSPVLPMTPLMHYLTDVEPYAKDDHDSAFGLGSAGLGSASRGRSSWKTEFLRQHGVFDESFTDEFEDLELGYRLARQGLVLRSHRDAVSYLTRPPTLVGACRQAEMQGRALVRLAVAHPDDAVLEYCRLHERARRWQDARNRLRRLLRRTRRLEREADVEDTTSAAAHHLFETYSELFGMMQGRGVARALNQLAKSDVATLEGARRGMRTTRVPVPVPEIPAMAVAHE